MGQNAYLECDVDMPDIRFKKLEVQNFKSIGEETSIDFEDLNQISLISGINNDVDGIDDIKANNGSGKSTIIDAILFSLYGRTLCSLSNRDLINRSIGTSLKTFSRFYFSIGEINYVSEAFLNIRGKSDPTVGFTLKIGDSDPVSRNTVQMRQMIEDEILGCPFDLFKSSIVISQSSYQNFYEMTKSQRVSYIEQLFKLTVFGDLLKMVRSDMRSDIVEYNATNMSRSNLVEQLQELALKSNSFESDMKGKSDKIATSIKLKESAIEVCKKEIDKIPEHFDLDDKKRKCIELKDNLAGKQIMISKLNSALSALNVKKDQLERSIGKHKEVLDVLCEDCFSKADSLLNITESKNQISECQKKIEIVKSALEQTKKEYDEVSSLIKETDGYIHTAEMDQKQKELSENQLEYLEKELSNLKLDFDRCFESENPFEGLIEKVKSNIAEYDNLMNDKNTSIKLKKFIEYVFSDQGAKNAILNDLANSINKLVKHYLVKLGSNYTVIFDSSFNSKFMTVSGESEFDSFSSGEKQRIILATMMAFRDLIVGNRIKSNVFILDETIDSGLDAVGVSMIVSSIVEMTMKTNLKLMLVSHNPSVKEKLKSMNIPISVVTAKKVEGKTSYFIDSL